ncbi:Emopamil binding protein-domain-containing protein [Xylariales sp. PMI_506]|nr:Emopamil binding protein-domain-containing protein [Xylariales sp. PMI_506]
MPGAPTFTEPPALAHPYYPLGVEIPGYAANTTPVPVLLAALSGMLGGVLVAGSRLALAYNRNLTTTNLAVLCWFVLCGFLHCFFEGYFIVNHPTVASSQSLFAQLWKEYALSDSRYLTSDPFMISVESITVLLWGPISFITAILIVRDSPLRHPAQIIMCMAHLYGVALYYSTSLVETYFTGRSHSRPEFVYFWVYYVGFNLPWVVVPLILLVDSLKSITRSLRSLDAIESGLNGFQKRNHDAQKSSAARKIEKKDQ